MKIQIISGALALTMAWVPATGKAFAYEEIAVTGGGAVKGQVVFNGESPTRAVIPTKDAEVCGGIRNEPQVIVGTDNGVQDAIVYLKAVPKGKKWEKPSKTPVIDNKNCRFEPHVQVIPFGMKLGIHNSDPVLHNTHGFLVKSTVFNVAMPRQGMQVEKPLPKPGLLRVECDSHGWMLAWIHVADNPYYAVTAKDGAYSIKDIPPGNYTLVVWQEYTGFKELAVTVKAGETLTVPVDITQ